MKKILTVLIVMLLVYSCNNESNRENDNANKFLITYIDSLELEFEGNISFDSLKYSPFYSSYISYKEYSDSLKILYNSDDDSTFNRVKKSYLKSLERYSHFGFEGSNFITMTEQLIDNRKSYSESEYVNSLLIRDVFAISELRKDVNRYDFKFDMLRAIVETDICNPKQGDSLDFRFSAVGISMSLNPKIKVIVEKQGGSMLSYDTIMLNENGQFVYKTIASKKGKHTLKGVYLLPIGNKRTMRLKFEDSYEVK